MDCFLTLQNQLFEQLNSLWESDDEEILEKIDELLLQEGSNYGLSLNEKSNLRKELFRSIRKLGYASRTSRRYQHYRNYGKRMGQNFY